MKKIIAMLFPSMSASFVGFRSVGKRNVDSALGQIKTALNELRTVKAEQDAEEQRQLDAAAAANSAANVANREAARAARVLAKIEELIG